MSDLNGVRVAPSATDAPMLIAQDGAFTITRHRLEDSTGWVYILQHVDGIRLFSDAVSALEFLSEMEGQQ